MPLQSKSKFKSMMGMFLTRLELLTEPMVSLLTVVTTVTIVLIAAVLNASSRRHNSVWVSSKSRYPSSHDLQVSFKNEIPATRRRDRSCNVQQEGKVV